MNLLESSLCCGQRRFRGFMCSNVIRDLLNNTSLAANVLLNYGSIFSTFMAQQMGRTSTTGIVPTNIAS